MKVIVNRFSKFIIPNGKLAIMLFGLIFSKRELTEVQKNHEKIHIQQYLDCVGVGGFILVLLLFLSLFAFGPSLLYFLYFLIPLLLFYFLYLVEFIIRWCMDSHHAYENISFEREAYSNQEDQCYPGSRTSFSWFKYFKK